MSSERNLVPFHTGTMKMSRVVLLFQVLALALGSHVPHMHPTGSDTTVPVHTIVPSSTFGLVTGMNQGFSFGVLPIVGVLVLVSTPTGATHGAIPDAFCYKPMWLDRVIGVFGISTTWQECEYSCPSTRGIPNPCGLNGGPGSCVPTTDDSIGFGGGCPSSGCCT